MIIELGHFALFIVLAAALLQAISGLYAGQTRNLTYSNMANGASDVAFIAVIFSFFVLVYAYLTSDFSVKNVAENSHTLKPLIYKIAGAWGNHEGSMLLWVVVAAAYGSSLAHFGKSLSFGLKARAMGIQGLIIAAVVGYVVFASNPFLRLDTPPLQGNDLNPLLQDPALAIHPPFLYLGYVGLSLVYSLAIAGLMEGKIDAAWARWLRPWVLASWVFLTIGILLGAYWAYYELGWGGWWFWDPVENASFMPWLLATALLHSAIVTEKRGALAAWTVLLSILAFSLSLLGTFLVRSGVITSVHAFALDPGRGIWILMILAFFTGGGLLLYGLKGAKMASDKGLFAPISRETALILNNLFLVVACFTILVGTLYPLVGEAIYGRAISVGAPYFNAVFTPLMSVILLVLPLATMLSWKRAVLVTSSKKLVWVALVAILGGLLVAFLAKNKPMSAVGIAIGIWVILAAIFEISNRIGLGKMPLVQSLKRLQGLRLMAIGMFLAHLGVGIFTISAVIETSFKTETTKGLASGES
ncbi:MAG: heme lyase CcmF/NrfE family subunit, partial [Pseudomonadota bacterium]